MSPSVLAGDQEISACRVSLFITCIRKDGYLHFLKNPRKRFDDVAARFSVVISSGVTHRACAKKVRAKFPQWPLYLPFILIQFLSQWSTFPELCVIKPNKAKRVAYFRLGSCLQRYANALVYVGTCSSWMDTQKYYTVNLCHASMSLFV